MELEAEWEQEGEMQGSVRWEKAAMVGGGELNIQQLRPDSLTRGFYVENVLPEVDGKNAWRNRNVAPLRVSAALSGKD